MGGCSAAHTDGAHRDLSSNKLGGKLPQSLGNLKNLTVLFGTCDTASQKEQLVVLTIDTGD